LRRTDIGLPGFAAQASIYRSEKTYAAPLLVPGSQMSRPNGIAPQLPPFPIRRIINRLPQWLTDCLMGCDQNRGACLSDIPNCTSMCEPDCIGNCAAGCSILPEQRQLDCLAACPSTCLGKCSAHCQIVCDTAYNDCVNTCYNPSLRTLPPPVPVIGRF
jgi:hypothetical protein